MLKHHCRVEKTLIPGQCCSDLRIFEILCIVCHGRWSIPAASLMLLQNKPLYWSTLAFHASRSRGAMWSISPQSCFRHDHMENFASPLRSPSILYFWNDARRYVYLETIRSCVGVFHEWPKVQKSRFARETLLCNRGALGFLQWGTTANLSPSIWYMI